MDTTARTEHLQLRLTAREKTQLTELAEQSGYDMSAYVRMLIAREHGKLSPAGWECTLAAFAGPGGGEDYDDELPDRSRGCAGCGEAFTPYHPAQRYCERCKSERAAKPEAPPCRICDTRTGGPDRPFCGACYGNRNNPVWLLGKFARYHLVKTPGLFTEVTDVRAAFKAWVRDELDLAPSYARLESSTTDNGYGYSKVLREEYGHETRFYPLTVDARLK